MKLVTEMKHIIGILIFGDPTRGGTITSEVKFLSNLYENNREDCTFKIITVNPSVTKRVIRTRDEMYSFPHDVWTVFDDDDMYKLQTLDAIVTYPGHSNFFGGMLNENIVRMYKIVSKCTNELNIPVFIRINDSEIKVRDYRLMCEIRLKGSETSAFMKDPINVARAKDLVSWKSWNYENIFWFANGSKETCDWVAETMYDREDENHRCSTRENFQKNSIYVSDDIFFLVRKNFEKYKSFESTSYSESKLCYIGFFDTVNVMRAKALNTLFKENKRSIPIKIFGKGTEILQKIQKYSNIDIEEGYIQGDSQKYFDFLNQHVGYIFIGKGQKESRYIGKTVYDAIVARTPVLVYSKCDSKHITFSSSEYYFDNEEELYEKYKKLLDPQTRKRWLDEQKKEIFQKLPPSTFKFSNYCSVKEKKEELVIENKGIRIVTALF